VRRFSSRIMAALLVLTTLPLIPHGRPFAAMVPATEHRLANGLRLILCQRHELPLISLMMVIPDGSRSDPQGKAGLASLTPDLLTEGTKTRKAAGIASGLDFIGASLETNTDVDYTTVSLTVLKGRLGDGLAIFSDIVLNPTFPEREVSRVRTEHLGQLQAEEENPGALAERAWLKALYGPGPYGHPPQGEAGQVKGITRDDVVGHHRGHYLPGGAILVAVGDFETEGMLSLLRERFGEKPWPQGKTPEGPPLPSSPVRSQFTLVSEPVSQANILLGVRGIRRDDPDYYALQVGNYILGGGGFASRLMAQVRAARGLAYQVSSDLQARKFTGEFHLVMQTANETADEAIGLARAELERMGREPVTEKELEGARRYLIGSFPLKLDSNAKLTRYLAAVTFYGLGLDYAHKFPKLIAAVTPEAILKAWREHLAGPPVIAVVADASKARLEHQPVGEREGVKE